MADINTIMKELKFLRGRVVYLEAQNKAIGDLIIKAPARVWSFPVYRTIKGRRRAVKALQELADIKTKTAIIDRRLQ